MIELTDVADIMNGNMTPIIAANAAIIAFISTRNVHLSDRSRSIVDEVLYKMHQDKALLTLTEQEKAERLRLLITQNSIFYWRYIGTSAAFVLAAASFVLFSGVSLLVRANGQSGLPCSRRDLRGSGRAAPGGQRHLAHR